MRSAPRNQLMRTSAALLASAGLVSASPTLVPGVLARSAPLSQVIDDSEPLIDEAGEGERDERGAIDLIDRPLGDPESAPPIEPPELAPSVLSLTTADYLAPAERAKLRVFHGLWNTNDLAEPALAAQAALIAGRPLHPAFDDNRVPIGLRIAGLLERGEARTALELLGSPEAGSMNAGERRSLRGRALFAVGEREAALTELQAAADLARRASNDAGQSDRPRTIVAGVEALRLVARLTDEEASLHREMVSLLSSVHQRIDRLYWPALALEAELLHEKGAWPAAQEAAMSALALNPRSAAAWRVLGQMAAGSFAVDAAESIASRLDAAAASVRTPEVTSPALSPDAALVLSRIRVRQNDPEGAAAAIARELAALPRHRALLARHAAIEALSYDEDRIAAALSLYEAVSPGSGEALHAVGSALSERRQYERAAEFLERGAEREPGWPEPAVELALLEMQAGRDERARDALARATELDPFNVRARNSRELAERLAEYEVIETEGFRIRFRPGVDRVVARDMERLAPEMHRRVIEAFGFEPDRPTTIELMPDSEFFAVRVTGMPSIFTMAASTGPVIAMEAPREGKINKGEYDWLRVLTHEYVHTVTLAKTKNRIPHWFTEAAAVYIEDAPREYSWWRLLASAWYRGDLFGPGEHDLGFIRPDEPSDRTLAYAQAEWMYEWLLERFGPDAPRELMTRYAQGLREDQAMRDVLGMSADAAYGAFYQWAGRQLAEVGLNPSPSLDALVLEQTLLDPLLTDDLQDEMARALAGAARRLAGVGPVPADGGPLLRPEFVRVTDATIAEWLAMYPDHPGVLRLAIEEDLAKAGGEVTPHVAEMLERYAAARPVDDEPHRILARHYLQTSGEAARAIPHLEYLESRETWTPVFAVELARRHAELGDWAAALGYAEQATLIAPYDANLRELAAEAALRARDLDAARWHIDALIILEPDREQHRKRRDAIDRIAGAS